ncbi:MAG: PorP/SprF family type IX secretion system membrane protein, partial [Cytophagales bacterium]|nr:PorP/SprF family type IX secretion system membrane protein [Cytophagales bacterium]
MRQKRMHSAAFETIPLASYFGIILFFLGVSFCVQNAKAQDPVFSQFYAAGLYLNPALAGAEKDISFSTNYRSQWKNVVVPYTTNQYTFIYPFVSHGIKNSHKGGIGASYYNDRAGDGNFKTNAFNANFAYNLQLSYTGLHYLSFGI